MFQSQQIPEENLQQSPLIISNVSKSFPSESGPVIVVNNLNFEMKPGEVLGLLGPNGAGKSTTINMIAGVLMPDSGSLSVFGFDNRKDYIKTRRLTGVMHQDPVIEQYLLVGQALKIHSGYYGVQDDPSWRELIIEQMELGPHLQKKYIKLSGGMRRRFMLAKTLLHKPRLIILDEPTAGVDVELRNRLWSFVREINNVGINVLLTTHYLDEAEEMCDRIAFMKDGKLITIEPTQDLIEKVGDQKLSLVLDKPVDEKDLKPFANYSPRYTSSERKELHLSLKSGSELTRVVELAQMAGISIADVYLSRPDLEDVFLKLSSEDKQ